MDNSVSKDSLLRRADALRSQGRRARKMSSTAAEGERAQLIERAQELERQATRFEKDAASAKDGVFPSYGPPGGKRAGSDPLEALRAFARAGADRPADGSPPANASPRRRGGP